MSYRRRGAGGAGLEVGQDGRDHPRVGDDGEHPQCCTAARATADVDVEHPAQTLSPRHLCASGRRPLVGTLAHRSGRRPGHDEAAMARIRGEQAVETNEVTARAWDQRGQAGDEVERFEQHMGRAIAKGMLQPIDHQAVPVAAQALQGNGGARHVPAQPLQLSAIASLAGDGRIERETVTSGSEGLRRLPPRSLECDSRGAQPKSLAPRDRPHGDPVADGRTLELRERILAFGVEVEPELFLVVILLRDQRAASHQRARDATDERVEEALEVGQGPVAIPGVSPRASVRLP